jgi:hypothetical protein
MPKYKGKRLVNGISFLILGREDIATSPLGPRSKARAQLRSVSKISLNPMRIGPERATICLSFLLNIRSR